MSNKPTSSSSVGIGFSGLLTVAFIVLKLVPGNPVNSWSWLWVLSPLWISALIAIAILIALGIGFLIYYWVNR